MWSCIMKLAVFPVTKDIAALVRHSDFLQKYKSIHFISPPGLIKEGSDLSEVDFGIPTGIMITNDLPAALADSDSILLSYSEHVIDPIVYLNVTELAREKKKSILFTSELLEYLGEKYELQETDAIIDSQPEQFGDEDKLDEHLYRIPVPVVAVAGIGFNCDKFSIQMKLNSYFKTEGYKVLCFGSNALSPLAGINSFPKCAISSNLGIKQRILAFNHHVYDTALKENPDLIIIGVPGGIMECNPRLFEFWEEIPLIVFSALEVDASVISLYSYPYSNNFFEEIMKTCRYKYGFLPTVYNICNMDYDFSTESERNIFSRIPRDAFLKKIFSKIEKNKFNVLSTELVGNDEMMFRKILAELE